MSSLFHFLYFLKNICHHWLHLGKKPAHPAGLLTPIHLSVSPLTVGPTLTWSSGLCHWPFNSDPSKAACMKNKQKKTASYRKESRPQAKPKQWRHQADGTRKQKSSGWTHSCWEAAKGLRSDWAAQHWEAGNTSQYMQIHFGFVFYLFWACLNEQISHSV